MSIHQRSEIEAKFRLGPSLDDLAATRRRIITNGYELVERRIETDYLPDTDDDSLKKANLLLRLREVTRQSDNKIILTLKIRDETTRLNHFHEVETVLGESDQDTILRIREIVQKKASLTFPSVGTGITSLRGVVSTFQQAGFGKVRILLDKYREEYVKGTVHVTLDYFPDGMGSFTEIEGFKETEVMQAVAELRFRLVDHLSDDYGDLLKAHKKHLGELESRQAVFNHKERAKLKRMIYDA